jgi:hypothetical protein
MHVLRGRWIGEIAPLREQGVAWLEEKERRLAVRIVPHFTGMVGIIATYAKDSIYRKQIRRSYYWEGWDRFGRNDISHRIPRFVKPSLTARRQIAS